MKPRLLNLTAGVSLLLAIAIVVLWVRSYWRHDAIFCSWHTSTERCGWLVRSRGGTLDFQFDRSPDKAPPIAPHYAYRDTTQYDSKYLPNGDWFAFPPPVRFRHLSARPLSIPG